MPYRMNNHEIRRVENAYSKLVGIFTIEENEQVTNSFIY